MTKVISCKCKNEYQDSTYGKGRRVANVTEKEVGNKVLVRCTVCGLEHAAYVH